VQFTIKSAGPGKFAGIYEFWNYSSMVNPVNRVNGRSWTSGAIGFTVNQGWHGHEGFEAWPHAHRSRPSGHSGGTGAHRRGRKREKGVQGSLCGPHQSSGDSMATGQWR
jgi:hypothetical protein